MADATPPEGGFFSRWSQRKVQARTEVIKSDSDVFNDKNLGDLDTSIVANSAIISSKNVPNNSESSEKKEISEKSSPCATSTASTPAVPAAPTGPTLADVSQLTADSDYSAFTAQSVDPQVRNAAMRKLFAANPHFNVMDGLDVYIDDYSVGEPIPKSMLRQMVQARSLGLLDDDLEDQDKPSSADAFAVPAANDTEPHHENANLQLQRDHAAGHSSADQSAGSCVEPAAKPEPAPLAGCRADIDNPDNPVSRRPG